MNKKILKSFYWSTLLLPLNTISCADSETLIRKYVDLNTADITVYDSIEELVSDYHLKINNTKYFKQNGISISLGDSTIDYESEIVNIVIYYRSKDDNKRKSIIISKKFYEFREPDNNDWKRIFNSIAKTSQIEWLGDDKFSIKNKYAKVSDLKASYLNKEQIRAEDFSYTLSINNSYKILNEAKDKVSTVSLKGGILLDKIKDGVTLTYKIPNNKDVVDLSLDKEFTKRGELIPTKEGHTFKGWSTNPDALIANVFLEGKESEIFEKDTILYPVFESYARLKFDIPTFPGEPSKSVETILGASGIVSKERIKEFIDEQLPSPLEYWSYDLDKITYIDQENERYNLKFDEHNNATFRFKSNHVYKLEINFKHLPRFIFKDEEGDILGSLWFAGEIEDMRVPNINLKVISDKEELGYYLEHQSSKYEANETKFITNISIPPSVADENNNIFVNVKFKLGREVTILTSEFEDEIAKSFPSKIYLNLEGKLPEKYIPKDVDYSWFKGEGKGIFTHSEFQNNEAFDKRSELEKQKGVVFEGWYSDPKFKNKIEFKNGFSTSSISSKMIYPKFSSSYWDKIRDIRHIMDAILTILSTGANVAGVRDEIEKYSKPIEYGINILKWIIFLALGGKRNSFEFWRGYQNINDLIFETTKDKVKICTACNGNNNKCCCNDQQNNKCCCNNGVYEAILWLSKDIAKNIFGIYQKYSKNKFKGSAFLDKKEKLEDWGVKDILGDGYTEEEERTKHLKHILMCCCKCNQQDNDGTNKTEEFARAIAGDSGLLKIAKKLIQLVIDSIKRKVDVAQISTSVVKITVELTAAIKKIVENNIFNNKEVK